MIKSSSENIIRSIPKKEKEEVNTSKSLKTEIQREKESNEIQSASDFSDKKKIFKIRLLLKKNIWSREEDNLLRSLVAQHGAKKWSNIAKYFENKSSVQCSARFRRMKRGIKKAPWSTQEDSLLLELMKLYGKDWTVIANIMKTRTGKQIRERFIHNLDPNIIRRVFNEEEVKMIFELQKKYGNKWTLISSHFYRCTGDMVKNTFYCYFKKVIKNEEEGKILKEAVAAKKKHGNNDCLKFENGKNIFQNNNSNTNNGNSCLAAAVKDNQIKSDSSFFGTLNNSLKVQGKSYLGLPSSEFESREAKGFLGKKLLRNVKKLKKIKKIKVVFFKKNPFILKYNNFHKTNNDIWKNKYLNLLNNKNVNNDYSNSNNLIEKTQDTHQKTKTKTNYIIINDKNSTNDKKSECDSNNNFTKTHKNNNKSNIIDDANYLSNNNIEEINKASNLISIHINNRTNLKSQKQIQEISKLLTMNCINSLFGEIQKKVIEEYKILEELFAKNQQISSLNNIFDYFLNEVIACFYNKMF